MNRSHGTEFGTKHLALIAGKIIDIDSRNADEWTNMLARNELIAVIYHSTVYCPVCESLSEVFREMSQEPEFSTIKFITIDTSNNPIADQYIRKRKQPFLATFRRSILIECNSVQTEEGLTRILTNLLEYNPGI